MSNSKIPDAVYQEKEAMMGHLKTLIEIPSHRDLSTKSEGKPFGEGIAKAFQALKEIGQDMGFGIHEEEGYAMDLRTGNGEVYIGVLCHLDTVEAIEMEKWKTNPYELVEKEGILYGRGVNDDKGPLLSALHAIKLVRDENPDFKYPIRLIVGGAEETTWECMDRYFLNNPQPRWAFSPDGDFPIVQGEKGILQVKVIFGQENMEENPGLHMESVDEYGFISDEIVLKQEGCQEDKIFTGKRALSRHPERGVNAVVPLIHYLKATGFYPGGDRNRLHQMVEAILDTLYKEDGDPFLLNAMDQDMGQSSVSLTRFFYEPGYGELNLDFRYTRIHSEESLLLKICQVMAAYGARVSKIKGKKLLFVEKDSALMKSLSEAYESVMEEKATLITKGGASYARVLERGVAFGPTFPGEVPNSHLENEKMPVASLLLAMSIYKEALSRLVRE